MSAKFGYFGLCRGYQPQTAASLCHRTVVARGTGYCPGQQMVESSTLLSWGKQQPETPVVVAVRGVVVVAVRGPKVLRVVVVPTAATIHPVRALPDSTLISPLSSFAGNDAHHSCSAYHAELSRMQEEDFPFQ